jgi:hypothetical protein
MDDNISRFWRMNRNYLHPARTGAIFRAAEDFVDRYENVALSGLQYFMFARSRYKHPAFFINTRIYSCILIRNDIPYRWRGRYNEDTDLSLRVLKDVWCTILFYAFLAKKTPTMRMKGGNTDELYRQDEEFDGRLVMAESLQEQHQDVAKITKKWGRYQHIVNYTHFQPPQYAGLEKNQLRLKPGLDIPKGVNEYGMVLKDRSIETDNDLCPMMAYR